MMKHVYIRIHIYSTINVKTPTIQIVKFSGQPVLSLVLNKKLHQIKKKRNKQ